MKFNKKPREEQLEADGTESKNYVESFYNSIRKKAQDIQGLL
jgi:hypothetical protein